jgi:hypothetical protein
LFLTPEGKQLVDDLDSLRDAIANDVMKNVSPEAIETSLGALREIKCRIKSLSDSPDHAAPGQSAK